jgi:cell division protein FtsB
MGRNQSAPRRQQPGVSRSVSQRQQPGAGRSMSQQPQAGSGRSVSQRPQAGSGRSVSQGPQTAAGRGPQRGSRGRWSNRMAILGITVVVFLLGAVVHFRSDAMRRKELDYQLREEQLDKQVKQEESRALELEEYRVYVQTKQYIEEVAKQKLGLVKPGEILLKPNPK